MMVTLQNDAKKHYPFLEGIYNLSTSGKNPKWKIIGGPHEIESYSGTWRIREYGSNSKIMTEDQSNDQMPDDDNYKWSIWNGTAWVNTTSEDVKIQGT